MRKLIVIFLILFSVVFAIARGFEIHKDYNGITAFKVKNTSASNKALSGIWAVNNANEYVGLYKAGTNFSTYSSDCLFINNAGDFIIINNSATAKDFKWYQATQVNVCSNGNITNIAGTNLIMRIDSDGDLNILTGSLALKGIAEPAADSGVGKVYVDTANSNLYYKDEGGEKVQLGASGDTTVYISNYVNQSGTNVLDMDGAGVQTYTLTNNITFSSASNLSASASKSISVYIIDDGGKRTLTFNASWLWIGTTPATMGSNATGLLLLTTKGNSQSDVIASYEETQ